MKLLVTNSHLAQAYAIIRALKPYTQKIVATMYGKHRFAARTSNAANSRFVSKRYYVPNPELDWQAGIIQKENTENEEAYVRAVLRICKEEAIDVIFPSFDPQVYIFSKNRHRFEKMGILIPVPDYETVVVPLDKYQTIRTAQQAGFPCPRTYLPESEDDLRRITEEMAPPWVIKPRFTAGGKGMEIATNFTTLLDQTRQIREHYSMPMIQEYIPGRQIQNFYMMVDQEGEVIRILCPKIVRPTQRLYRGSSACESAVSHPYVSHVTRLVRRLGWWGGLTVQTKIDVRDGTPKLMEINPRLGSHLWYRTELGVNEPLMCLKIARGEEIQGIADYPVGTLLLEPMEDVLRLSFTLLDLLLYKFRTSFQGREPIDPLNSPLSLQEVIRSYKRDYFGGAKKKFSPHFRYILEDPLPGILRCYAFAGHSLRLIKKLGR